MNPLVRPHLQTYPEDSGQRLQEVRQAQRWRDEVDPNIAAPMARGEDGKDYFVGEPCLVHLETGPGVVAPSHWFRRADTMWSTAYPLVPTDDNTGYMMDRRTPLEVELSSYVLNVDDLASRTCQEMYKLPPPVIQCA